MLKTSPVQIVVAGPEEDVTARTSQLVDALSDPEFAGQAPIWYSARWVYHETQV